MLWCCKLRLFMGNCDSLALQYACALVFLLALAVAVLVVLLLGLGIFQGEWSQHRYDFNSNTYSKHGECCRVWAWSHGSYDSSQIYNIARDVLSSLICQRSTPTNKNQFHVNAWKISPVSISVHVDELVTTDTAGDIPQASHGFHIIVGLPPNHVTREVACWPMNPRTHQPCFPTSTTSTSAKIMRGDVGGDSINDYRTRRSELW